MNEHEDYCPVCFCSDLDYDTSTDEQICLNCGERWIGDEEPGEDELDEF